MRYGISIWAFETSRWSCRGLFFKKINFKDGDVFVDCGANVGDLKLWFKINSININYVGFEPSPIEFKCLKNNVKPSKVHNVGLWKDNSELKFYISSQGADSSLIEPKKYEKAITINVCRLDSFFDTKIKYLCILCVISLLSRLILPLSTS